jgi:hypothetical protein
VANSDQGRKTQNFIAAGGTNNPILFDQEIHVIIRRALAGQTSQSAGQIMRQAAATFILGHFADLADDDFWHMLLNLKIRKFLLKNCPRQAMRVFVTILGLITLLSMN